MGPTFAHRPRAPPPHARCRRPPHPRPRTVVAAATRRDALLAAAAAAPCLCAVCALRTAPGQRFYKSTFAAVMAEGMASYEREVEGVKRDLFGRTLARLLERKGGALDVVDVGVGAAPNARFLPPAAVNTYVGIDPNEAMQSYAVRAATAAGLPFSFAVGDAASLPTPPASADLAVCTLLLCSVADPAAAVAGIAASLRPGGALVFIEHVAADPATHPFLSLAQRALSPLQSALADGCRLTRDPEPVLAAARGLALREVASFDVAGGGLIAPHKAGVAVRV